MKIDSKNRSFIFWKWVNELDPFFWIVTQRILFVKYDSNGTFFLQIWHKELNFFEYDSKIWFFSKKNHSQNSTFFLRIWPKNWPLFLEYDAQNWTLFFQICLELNFFFQNTTQTFEHFWKIWLKELNFLFLIRLEVLNSLFWIRLKELNPFWCDSKNCFSKKRLKELNYFMNMTQRFFEKKMWLKESNFFFYDSRFNLFVFFFFKIDFFKKKKKIMTQRIEFFEYDSKNWTFFFFENDSQNWIFSELNHFSLNVLDSQNCITQRIFFWMELLYMTKNGTKTLIDLFFEYDSKNWTFFFSKVRLTELNPFSLNIWSMTQRIEPFISWVWRN